MRKHILCSFFICLCCLFLISCYIYSGFDISKKNENEIHFLDDNYYVMLKGAVIDTIQPNINLFQLRKGDKIESYYFVVHKKNTPIHSNVHIEIQNAYFKIKEENICSPFYSVKGYINKFNSYYLEKNQKSEVLWLSDEERNNGLIGGVGFFLDFSDVIDPRLIEYIEFDIIITEAEITETYHVHYDINTRKVFKIGSTLWEYWSSI